MSTDDWHPFDSGTTIGQPGSELGTILRDDEHSFGARITLERGTPPIPFAITCGVYGTMVHTRYFSSQTVANNEYDLMRDSLGEILERTASAAFATDEVRVESLVRDVNSFVERFP